MRLKPKTTVGKTRALLYKRFIGLEKADTKNTAYVFRIGTAGNYTYRWWTFDGVSQQFIYGGDSQPVGYVNSVAFSQSDYFQFQRKYFHLVGNLQTGYTWEESDTLPAGSTALSAMFNNIGKYQVNKYYFAGSFDFLIKGSVEGTTTQYIKGNIAPLTSFNIVHYNDYVQLSPDDLVVIDGHLYSVENPESTPKYQPKNYFVYHATLNSIL